MSQSSQVSRRAIAKGAAWSVPAVTVASAAPAMAASCSDIKAGAALPASLFQGYFAVTNQTFGGGVNKVDTFIAGIWLNTSDPRASCVIPSPTSAPAITSFALNTTNSGTMTLTNNNTYSVFGGAGIAGTGTVGSKKGDCSGPGGTNADACVTYTGNSLRNSTGTSGDNPKSAVLNFTVKVAGYAQTTLTFTVPSFKPDGTNWDGVNVLVS